MATTLPAPPERVWPWLVQMGLGRGGWYSWDWLNNDGAPSADRIVTHWQHLEVGQHLDRVPKGPTNRWTVAVLEPDRTLVLQGSYGSLTGQGFDPRSGPRLGHGWKGSGASICGRPRTAGPTIAGGSGCASGPPATPTGTARWPRAGGATVQLQVVGGADPPGEAEGQRPYRPPAYTEEPTGRAVGDRSSLQ